MGQPVLVSEKLTSYPGVVRFECNRTLTGTGHERFETRADALGITPADELARQMFDHGGVDRVHINGNVITVDLAKGATATGLKKIVEDLFLYYREGTTPPTP